MARQVVVVTDEAVAESEAVISDKEGRSAAVTAAFGSPQRPMPADRLADKVRGLAGDILDGILDAAEPGKAYLDVMDAGRTSIGTLRP
jgi:hypothetical protein